MSPVRDAELTRQHILEVTAQEMRVKGYKAASLSDILQKAGVSKGALYHHFANKQELGYAVFDEVFIREFLENWSMPLRSADPIDALCALFAHFSCQTTCDELEVGCPIYNIATEMSGVDEGFRHKAFAMFDELRKRLTRTILDAQARGLARADIDAEGTASFVMAAVQGAMMHGKYGRDVGVFQSSIQCLIGYLQSLKA